MPTIFAGKARSYNDKCFERIIEKNKFTVRLRDVENINVPSIAWIRVDFARLAISKCEGIVSYFELFEMANRTKAT